MNAENLLASADQQLLSQFAASMRRPKPKSSDPCVSVYQRLFFNNVRSLLTQSFPVTAKLLGPELFECWVAHFYEQHAAQTPRFTELAPEFLSFIQFSLSDQNALSFGYPALALVELLHYEWVETELMLSSAKPAALLPNQLMLSPLARLLAYQFPVHQISAQQPPTKTAPAQPTYLLLWRDPQMQVKFQALNLAAVQVLLPFQQAHSALPENADAQAWINAWCARGVLQRG